MKVVTEFQAIRQLSQALICSQTGGQHAEYIVKALEGYKNGSRSHPTMTALAKTLSQKDIEELAAYYAKK